MPGPSNADTSLTIIRNLNAPIVDVYNAWTDPAVMGTWFAPNGYHVEELELDVRAGGRYRTVAAGTQGDRHTTVGEYLEVAPNARLVLSWIHDGDPATGDTDASRLIVTFRETSPTTTRLTLVHEQIATPSGRDALFASWIECLHKLETIFQVR
ncbi:MAG TPA: SRPBCC family protein [Thermomicrobiales bacterium]|nr:SRPBCC family protein [Thermomicrobiales bacterium]